jgi:hypothetical protein
MASCAGQQCCCYGEMHCCGDAERWVGVGAVLSLAMRCVSLLAAGALAGLDDAWRRQRLQVGGGKRQNPDKLCRLQGGVIATS